MNGLPDGYDVSVNVQVYRRLNGERMGLNQDWKIDAANPSYAFQTLAEFAELAETIKGREAARQKREGTHDG